MKVIVGKNAGFCFGVKNAVEKASNELEKNQKIYCLGELVHNEEVTKELEKNGMIFINNIEEAKGKVIIRAHGEPEETYKKAKQMNLEVIDLTCPKVASIHKIVKEYTKRNYFIILTGKTEHPEVIGIEGYCDNNCLVIENTEEIGKAVEKIKKSNLKNILLISQTTYSLEKFQTIEKMLQDELENENLEIINTICLSTKLRQEETLEISKKVDAIIVIGGKNSSNTTKLYDISKKICPSFFIQNAEQLPIEKIKKFKTIGVTAGASTPYKSIKKVIDMIEKL